MCKMFRVINRLSTVTVNLSSLARAGTKSSTFIGKACDGKLVYYNCACLTVYAGDLVKTGIFDVVIYPIIALRWNGMG